MDQKNKQHQQPQQGKNDNNKNQSGKSTTDSGKSQDPHKTAKHLETSDADADKSTEDDLKPEKSTEIGDDPDTTKKKIPNMNK